MTAFSLQGQRSNGHVTQTMENNSGMKICKTGCSWSLDWSIFYKRCGEGFAALYRHVQYQSHKTVISISQSQCNLFYCYCVTGKCQNGWYLPKVCLWWGICQCQRKRGLRSHKEENQGVERSTPLYIVWRGSHFGGSLPKQKTTTASELE